MLEGVSADGWISQIVF